MEFNMKNTIIIFKPFVIREFMEFKERSINDYSQALIRSGKNSESNALGEALKEYDAMLPQGIDTPNHHFNNITNEQGENIGYIWFEIRSKDMFICEFLIYENHRGKGYGRQTLFELEQIAERMSVSIIRLHAFEYNTGLQKFYKYMGYEITSTRPGSCFMQKVI